MSALLFGRPTVSRSHIGSLLARLEFMGALQDQAPLAHTLERLIDFDRFAQSKTRLIICAVALDPDEPVVFDSACTKIDVAHLMASAAMPVPVSARLHRNACLCRWRVRTQSSGRACPGVDETAF